MPVSCTPPQRTGPSKSRKSTGAQNVTNRSRGIVIMGVGPGALSTAAINAANDLFERGVITVASFRPFFGATVPSPQPDKM